MLIGHGEVLKASPKSEPDIFETLRAGRQVESRRSKANPLYTRPKDSTDSSRKNLRLLRDSARKILPMRITLQSGTLTPLFRVELARAGAGSRLPVVESGSEPSHSKSACGATRHRRAIIIGGSMLGGKQLIARRVRFQVSNKLTQIPEVHRQMFEPPKGQCVGAVRQGLLGPVMDFHEKAIDPCRHSRPREGTDELRLSTALVAFTAR